MSSVRPLLCASVLAACGGAIADEPDASQVSAQKDASADHALDVFTQDDAHTTDVVQPPPSDGGTLNAEIFAYTAFPGPVVVDEKNVYFAVVAGAKGTAVSECAITGCNKKPTVLWTSQDFKVFGLGVANDSVYFTANGQYIASCATTGCNGTPTNLLSSLTTTFSAFGVDATNVYFNDSSNARVAACALAGCNNAPATLVTYDNFASGFAQTDTQLIWSEQDNITSIETCAKNNCAATKTALASNRVGALEVATDGQTVYWVELGASDGNGAFTNGSIRSCALSGCNDDPTALVTYASWNGATAIAADSSGVYWCETIGSSTHIVGCASGGCAGSPKVYSIVAGAAYGIALTSTSLYWSDNIASEILTAPK